MTTDKPIMALSIRDACAAVGIGRSTLYGLINSGQLEARALGGRTIIPAESLERLVAGLPAAPIRVHK